MAVSPGARTRLINAGLVLMVLVPLAVIGLTQATAQPGDGQGNGRAEARRALVDQAPMSRVLSITRDMVIDEPLVIPEGTTIIDGGGHTITTTGREFAPLQVIGAEGLLIRDLTLVDPTKDQGADGKPGLFVLRSERVTVQNVRVVGFAPAAVFRECVDVVVDQSHFERSGSWNVLFADCERVAVNGGSSTHAWLDGYKLAGTHHWALRGVNASHNGASVESDPTSNGNGIDTYTGSSHGLIDGGTWDGNRGAAINLKTGPKDAVFDERGAFLRYEPTHDILIRGVSASGNAGPIVDVNSMSAAFKVLRPLRDPYNITIDGIRGVGNGHGPRSHGQAVRVGHGQGVLFAGMWAIEGRVQVTDQSDAEQRQYEVIE